MPLRARQSGVLTCLFVHFRHSDIAITTIQSLSVGFYCCVKKKKKTSPKIPFVRLSRTRRCGTFSICIIMFRLCRMIPRPDNRLARGSRRRRACVIARASEYCDIKINMQTPRSCASKNRRSFFFSFSALRFARTLRFRVYTSGGGAAPCISLSFGQTTLTTRKKKNASEASATRLVHGQTKKSPASTRYLPVIDDADQFWTTCSRWWCTRRLRLPT